MKSFICLVLCALVAATYAAPARFSNQAANIEALLSQSLQDRAEMEGIFSFLKKAGKGLLKAAPHIIGALGDGGKVQADDDDDDDDIANIEALFSQSFQDRAEMEGIFSFLKKAGKGLLKAAPHIIGALGDGAEKQDDDDDDDAPAKIEALLSQSLQDRAEMENFWDILKKVGKVALGALGDRGQEQEVNQAEAQFWGSVLTRALNLLGKKKWAAYQFGLCNEL